ncbi:hypothetical protein [Gemmiger sp. An50]|uniref:hypothetical protein n=1 Tax=Gemmiger sp. An50 TaxID=1965639 RepID=UPI000B3760D3|nr:hypothetical protein [Gemmiger sp. An50]OUN81990.1 hypothetical protein B5G03_16660 [Gemmiger sp. An50]
MSNIAELANCPELNFIEHMLKEQENQGKRLEILEGRDGEQWRKVVGYAITAVLGIALGYIFKQIGM